LARQLYSAAVITKGRTVICGIIITITRFLGVKPNPDDRVSGSERLDRAAFELMNFCKVEAGRLCWIYPDDRLLLFSNIDRTTLLHQANLYWIPGEWLPRLFNPHSLHPLLLVNLNLVLPPNHPPLTMPTSKPP